jgi:hypothetical protein
VFAFCLGLALLPAPDQATKPLPCKALTCWQPQVQYRPDPVRDGAPGPVLVGRLYLLNGEIKQPVSAEGSVVVDLYDVAGSREVKLEEWRIDAETLNRLLKRDPIGWGYTLSLPWSTYRTGVSQVVLKTRFAPLQGPPLYDLGCPMKLEFAKPQGD